jgi:hypothetical protein
MKITEDICKYATKQGISENEALEKDLEKNQRSLPNKARDCT